VLGHNGGQEALYNLFQCLLGPGDDAAVLPVPSLAEPTTEHGPAGRRRRCGGILHTEAPCIYRRRCMFPAPVSPGKLRGALSQPQPAGCSASISPLQSHRYGWTRRRNCEATPRLLRRHPQVAVAAMRILQFLPGPPPDPYTSFAAQVAPDAPTPAGVCGEFLAFAKGAMSRLVGLGYSPGAAEWLPRPSALASSQRAPGKASAPLCPSTAPLGHALTVHALCSPKAEPSSAKRTPP